MDLSISFDQVFNGMASKFDHSLVLLKLYPFTNKPFQRKFHFKNSWLLHPDLPQTVEHGWAKSLHPDMISKLNNCTFEMNSQGHQIRSKFHTKIYSCHREMEHLCEFHDEELAKKYQAASQNLNCLINQEESFWKQCAKVYQLKDGDISSSFFHSMLLRERKGT